MVLLTPKITFGKVTSNEFCGISFPVASKTSIVSSSNEKLQALKVEVISLAITPKSHPLKLY